jgi:HAD superfamily 5'-nucleotidase-like hydrolase
MTISLPALPKGRGVFCNRTLNLRAIRAIGYDMDYTLVDYDVDAWERRVYEGVRDGLVAKGWPIGHLRFEKDAVIRGLIIDTEKGNLIKANRFGFVKRAVHGTKALEFEEQRAAYARTIVDLSESRWVFLNTLFSLSEACIYGQLVELLDARALPVGVMGYRELYGLVRSATDAIHQEGTLKREIMADPEKYVVVDPELPLTLLDQRGAGKKLMLITNSEWGYTSAMMTYAFDRFLPEGKTWRDVFDVVVVGARKPEFFTQRTPFFEVVSQDGLLRPCTGPIRPGVAYLGGSANQVEQALGLSGDEILYVGDHMFGDVHVSKSALRWRTGLVLRELESEVEAIVSFQAQEAELAAMMEEKERLENEFSQLRIALQRKQAGYGPVAEGTEAAWHASMQSTRARLVELDAQIAPLARTAAALGNAQWGLLTRAGNDKSHLARQVERYADVYTSRVSNFLHATPFVYLRSPRGSLPHDPSTPGGPPLTSPSLAG